MKINKALLYWIVDPFNTKLAFEEVLIKAYKGGVDMIQLRMKETTIEEVKKYIMKIKEMVNIPVIVNDYIELVEVADGVHLGEKDYPCSDVRALTDKILGCSVYDNIEKAAEYEALGVDYIGFSSPFASITKEKIRTTYSSVKEIIKNVNIPVYLVGGISIENIELLLNIGVKYIAVSSVISNSLNPYITAKTLKTLIFNG